LILNSGRTFTTNHPKIGRTQCLCQQKIKRLFLFIALSTAATDGKRTRSLPLLPAWKLQKWGGLSLQAQQRCGNDFLIKNNLIKRVKCFQRSRLQITSASSLPASRVSTYYSRILIPPPIGPPVREKWLTKKGVSGS
jgi:hypothetical protein